MREKNLALTPDLMDALRQFCERNHVARLALFGSVLRDDFRPDSDIDVLIEFLPNHVPGYIGLAGMQFQLQDILGREVDLRTAPEMSRFFRDQVQAEAEVLYAAAA